DFVVPQEADGARFASGAGGGTGAAGADADGVPPRRDVGSGAPPAAPVASDSFFNAAGGVATRSPSTWRSSSARPPRACTAPPTPGEGARTLESRSLACGASSRIGAGEGGATGGCAISRAAVVRAGGGGTRVGTGCSTATQTMATNTTATAGGP